MLPAPAMKLLELGESLKSFRGINVIPHYPRHYPWTVNSAELPTSPTSEDDGERAKALNAAEMLNTCSCRVNMKQQTLGLH